MINEWFVSDLKFVKIFNKICDENQGNHYNWNKNDSKIKDINKTIISKRSPDLLSLQQQINQER